MYKFIYKKLSVLHAKLLCKMCVKVDNFKWLILTKPFKLNDLFSKFLSSSMIKSLNIYSFVKKNYMQIYTDITFKHYYFLNLHTTIYMYTNSDIFETNFYLTWIRVYA